MFHGPAVFTGSVDAEGNTVGLDEATALVVAGMATHAHTDGPAVRADTHTANADDDTARHHGGEPR